MPQSPEVADGKEFAIAGHDGLILLSRKGAERIETELRLSVRSEGGRVGRILWRGGEGAQSMGAELSLSVPMESGYGKGICARMLRHIGIGIASVPYDIGIAISSISYRYRYYKKMSFSA